MWATRIAAVAAAAGLAIGAAPAAQAGSWSDEFDGKYHHHVYTAHPGEVNDVLVEGVATHCCIGGGPVPENSRLYLFTDLGAEPSPLIDTRQAVVADTVGARLGDGNDKGGASIAWIDGGPGNDTLNGTGGTSLTGELFAGAELFGGEGNDYLSGGAGNDLLVGGAGGDTINCGLGFDRVFADALDWVSDTCESVTLE